MTSQLATLTSRHRLKQSQAPNHKLSQRPTERMLLLTRHPLENLKQLRVTNHLPTLRQRHLLSQHQKLPPKPLQSPLPKARSLRKILPKRVARRQDPSQPQRRMKL